MFSTQIDTPKSGAMISQAREMVNRFCAGVCGTRGRPWQSVQNVVGGQTEEAAIKGVDIHRIF